MYFIFPSSTSFLSSPIWSPKEQEKHQNLLSLLSSQQKTKMKTSNTLKQYAEHMFIIAIGYEIHISHHSSLQSPQKIYCIRTLLQRSLPVAEPIECTNIVFQFHCPKSIYYVKSYLQPQSSICNSLFVSFLTIIVVLQDM